MKYDQLARPVRECVDTMPPTWQAQVLRFKNWHGEGGWPAGVIQVGPEESWVIDTPITLPPRVGLSNPHGGQRTLSPHLRPAFGFPVGAPLIECLRNPANETTSDGNFGLVIEGLGLECDRIANGMDLMAAQTSRVVNNRIRQPLDYGILVRNGSLALDVSGNDFDAGPMATAYIFERGCRAIHANGGSVVRMRRVAKFEDGVFDVDLRAMFIENVERGAAFAQHAHHNEVSGTWEGVTGPLCEFRSGRGGDWQNRVKGVLRKTADPHHIDREGKVKELTGSAWTREQWAGQGGWEFEAGA